MHSIKRRNTRVLTTWHKPNLKYLIALHVKIIASSIVIACGLHATPSFSSTTPTTSEIIDMASSYCGSCHPAPSPTLLPKRSWPAVIDSMATLAHNYTGNEFIPKSVLPHLKALYFGSSPESLPMLPYIEQMHPEIGYRSTPIGESTYTPQILNISQVTLGSQHTHSFLVCDGESKSVNLLESDGGDSSKWTERIIAKIDIPIATQVVDYNDDGLDDILVADLGELPPNGQLAGKIFLLQQDSNENFSKLLMMHKLGRVTDMNALDIDLDGDLDLAVSVFGGGGTGEIFWMEKLENGSHTKHQIMNISGALNISPIDLNKDGLPDFLTLVAQEHEKVFALINNKNREFIPVEIFSAGYPLFGATSMSIADLNLDGKLDILISNGDAFDTQTDPKPYHGVHWLENKGDLHFEHHIIHNLYGAANARASDLDNDGDEDIVATSWINYWEDPKRQSIVWFENTGEMKFQAHPISGSFKGLVPIVIADITGDGLQDIISGSFRMDILQKHLTTRDGQKVISEVSLETDKRTLSSRLILFETTRIDRLPAP